MVTQPLNTAKVYVLSASSACSVTLTHLGQSTTWQALPEGGGQTTFIVPAGAVAEFSDENVLLSPLPFKIAPGAGGCSVGGTAESDTRDLLPLKTTESNAALSLLTWEGLCAAADTEWLKNAFLNCVNGDTAYIDLSACTPTSTSSFSYKTTATPLLAGDPATGQLRLGEGVKGLKRMVLKIHNEWRDGSSRTRLCNPDVDFTIITQGYSLCDYAYMGSPANRYQAKSLTMILPEFTGGTNMPYTIGHLSTNLTPSINEGIIDFPIKIIAPAFKNGARFVLRSWVNREWVDDEIPMHVDITAALPNYVSSFSFYKTNFNSAENLVFLMNNLGKPAAESLPQLSFGIDAALVDTSGDAPVYHNEALQTAVESLRAKGWEDVPYPLTEAE